MWTASKIVRISSIADSSRCYVEFSRVMKVGQAGLWTRGSLECMGPSNVIVDLAKPPRPCRTGRSRLSKMM
jgi:hypothetical protein